MSLKKCPLLLLAVVFCFFAIGPFALQSKAAAPEGVSVPIFMYHSLDTKKRDIWTLSPDSFEEDLRYLSENGYQAVFISELINYVYNGTPLPEKPVVLTFDDGYYNNYVQGLPLVEKYDMKMVLSVIGKEAQLFSDIEDLNEQYGHLSWEQMGQLLSSGRVELANHSWDMHSHKNGRNGCCRVGGESLEKYQKTLTEDVGKLQDMLQKNYDVTPQCFTYPFGSICSEANDILQQLGFKATLSCYEGVNTISQGDTQCLLNMHRNNRTPKKSVQYFIEKFMK